MPRSRSNRSKSARKSPARKSPRKSPARKSARKLSPLRKNVGKKSESPGKRFSARGYYDSGGKVGDKKKILQPNGKYKTKVLKLRENGSPFWAMP